MRLGLLLFPEFGPEVPRAQVRRAVLAQAETAEASGWDGVWAPTDIGWTRLQPLALLGAIAAATSRVTVGTAVLLAPLYHPVELAEAAATMDLLSNGRLILGLGQGWRAQEFAAAGVPERDRVGRFREMVPLLKRLLEGEEVTAPGRHFQLDHVAVECRPVQSPRPPIWLGAHRLPAIARAARLGDAWIGGPFTDRARLAKQIEVYRAERRARGLPVDRLPILRDGFAAASAKAARRIGEEPLRAKYREYAARVGAMAFDVEAPFEELARDRLLWGSPDDWVRELSCYEHELGVTDVIVRLQYRGMEPAAALEAIELVGREVLPRLAGGRTIMK